MICDYGCGKEANYQLKNGKRCCCKYTSQCEEVKRKSTIGLSKAHKDGKLSHKTLDNGKGRNYKKKKIPLDFYLSNKKVIKSYTLKLRLIEENLKEHKCECCKLEVWNEEKIPLELHHIDRNHLNNQLENLQLLCPNCHAQTDGYKNNNLNKITKIPDDIFIGALKRNKNIKQALEELGLSTRGGNYIRAKKLLSSISPT